MRDLQAIRAALLQLVGGEANLNFISVRVMLRTGVNLNAPTPELNRDPNAVNKVLSALRDLGYHLKTESKYA
jgi:hypothetical protein